MRIAFLVAAAFLASTVEMVEALTIVLAVGVTRGWRSTLGGVVAATLALAAVVAALGPALTVIPIESLRLFVGGLLLVFGLQWMRKAILRASGHKALHDEEAIFAKQRQAALAAGIGQRESFDPYSFTVAFKGVFLEGLEVVFIVLSFGSTQHQTGWAALGAAVAVVVVGSVGVAIHAPLARVPENTMKFVVGIMLTTFGIFWGGEGAGVHWPGGDSAIPVVLAWVAAVALVLVMAMRDQAAGVGTSVGESAPVPEAPAPAIER